MSNLITLQYSRSWCQRRLRNLMSDISEGAHCAQWLVGTEETLPPLLVEAAATAKSDADVQEVIGRGYHGFGFAGSLEEVQEAVMLAGKLGNWVDHNARAYFPRSMS